MSSGSAAFKAAAVAAVLAVLILPSFGRCPSQGPAPAPPAGGPVPPPPAPAPVPVAAPAPGPAPPVLCSNCSSYCSSKCSAKVAAACSNSCDPPASCEQCKSMVLNNNCTTCDRQSACFVPFKACQDCRDGEGRLCNEDCMSKCDATCEKKIKKEQ